MVVPSGTDLVAPFTRISKSLIMYGPRVLPRTLAFAWACDNPDSGAIRPPVIRTPNERNPSHWHAGIVIAGKILKTAYPPGGQDVAWRSCSEVVRADTTPVPLRRR